MNLIILSLVCCYQFDDLRSTRSRENSENTKRRKSGGENKQVNTEVVVGAVLLPLKLSATNHYKSKSKQTRLQKAYFLKTLSIHSTQCSLFHLRSELCSELTCSVGGRVVG